MNRYNAAHQYTVKQLENLFWCFVPDCYEATSSCCGIFSSQYLIIGLVIRLIKFTVDKIMDLILSIIPQLNAPSAIFESDFS